MPDALRATIELMEAPAEQIRERGSYNLSAMSFTPAQIGAEIARRITGFNMEYAPDFRQAIARTWPRSIDDATARREWGWTPHFTLSAMVEDMLLNLRNEAATSAGNLAQARTA